MRAKEFINEHDNDDLHSWVALAKSEIMDRIAKGDIPNNPDSIKSAAKQLAMDNKDVYNDVSPDMLASEVETQLFHDSITPMANLGGAITNFNPNRKK